MSEKKSVAEITVEEFHKIVAFEYEQLRMYRSPEGVATDVKKLLLTMANTNADGVLTPPFNDAWMELYNGDELFRRIWGSVACSMELFLGTHTGQTYAHFSHAIRSSIARGRISSGVPTLTQVDIVEQRLSVSQQDASLQTCAHGDFWLECLAYFRLTIRHSLLHAILEASATRETKP